MTTTNSNDSHIPEAKGYWIVLAEVREPSQFGRYTSIAGPLIAAHGGRVLARGDVAVIVEGSVPGRPYLIEFPSYAAALACFQSPGYQEAINLRFGVADFRIVIAQGFVNHVIFGRSNPCRHQYSVPAEPEQVSATDLPAPPDLSLQLSPVPCRLSQSVDLIVIFRSAAYQADQGSLFSSGRRSSSDCACLRTS